MAEIYDNEQQKATRRSALWKIKAEVESMLAGGVDNPRMGYKTAIQSMERAINDLKFSRSVEDGYDWEFD